MKIAVISANLNNFDPVIDFVEQSIPYDFFKFTDNNFLPRHCVMTPKMQARIPKMFGWQLRPGYDFYVWIDASCILSHKDSLKWFMDKCSNVDFAVFKHPNRNTIQEEADYLKKRLMKKCPYITPRYENEFIDEQLAEIKADKEYVDDLLIASTAMVYRNNIKTQKTLKELWYHTSRYHNNEQLSFPYVLKKSGCSFNLINEEYMKIPYIKYIRR